MRRSHDNKNKAKQKSLHRLANDWIEILNTRQFIQKQVFSGAIAKSMIE